jgi:hypothetical protein
MSDLVIFCVFPLMVSAIVKKYVLNELEIVLGLSINFPLTLIFKISFPLFFLPDSLFTISQIVLILLLEFKIFLS